MKFIVEPMDEKTHDERHKTLCALCSENPRFCGPGGDDWKS
jgi:hypothetical protein